MATGSVLMLLALCLPFLNSINLNRRFYATRCIMNIAERYFPSEKTLAISWSKINQSLSNRNPFKIHTLPLGHLFFKELHQWSLCIYRTRVKMEWHRELFLHGGYMVFSYFYVEDQRKTTRMFMKQMIQFYSSCTWNPHAPFIVTLMNTVDDPPSAASVFLGMLKWYKIQNSVVIVTDNKSGFFNLYTWLPDKCDSFRAVSLDSWVMEDEGFFALNANLFPDKIKRDYGGCPLRAYTLPARPSVGLPVITFSNKTRKWGVRYEDGWEVNLFKVITHKLNMTEKYIIPRGGLSKDIGRILSYDIADVAFRAYITRNETYSSTTRGYHWDTTRWYVPCGKKYPRWDSISRMFDWIVWISWVTCIILAGGTLTFLSQNAVESKAYKSFMGSLTYSCSMTLGISVPQKPKTSPLRWFFLSWVCYSLALDTVFQTFLTTYLTDPGMMPPIANMKELVESDLALGVSHNQIFLFNGTDDLTDNRILQKWIDCYFNSTCYLWAARHHNLSLLATEMWFNNISAMYEKSGIPRSSLCTIEGGDIETVFTVMFLQRGSLYLDHFNRIIDNVMESGIFRHWTEVTYHEQKVQNRTELDKTPSHEYCQLTLELMQSVFYLLLMGFGVGFIILICECVCHSVTRSAKLPYVLSIEYGNHEALLPPQLNISTRGLVPTRVQTFRVRFPCTGRQSAEVAVILQLNVSTHNPLHNETALTFRRNKICLKEEPTPRNDSIRLDPGSLVTSSGTFYVAVGCACVMIIVVIAVTSVVYVKSKKARTQESLHTTYTTAAYGSNPNVFIRLDSVGRPGSVGSGSYATIASFHKLPLPRASPCPYATANVGSATYITSTNGSQFSHHIYSKPASRVSYYASSQLTHLSKQVTLNDPRMQDPAGRLRDLATPNRNITTQVLLHEGTFGRVYRGEYRNEATGNHTEVLVKTVSDQASKLQVSLMLAEGTMLHGMSHKNVLPILAASLDNPKQPLLVYPYSNKGNLKRFLQNCHQRGEAQYTLLTQDIVDMAIQVVLAMLFLHSQRICHKDLATRNCVVDEKLRVRVTDNALARDLFPTDYYCLGDNENRPIKWLAIESLLHKQFSGASDVWSFGVLLWELTTLAQQPYVEVDPFEMAAYLRDGYRLAQPINCPDELFALMACCWLGVPDERPTFVQLLACLQEFYTALGRYI